jgi:DNA-binding response OmpR family regulator
MSGDTLAGRRILLVEDELLIAMLLETSLEDHGCVVVGPFGRLSDAMEAAAHEHLDGALMDVNLGGERVFPAADILSERAVPFLLLSGYGDKALPDHGRHWPVQSKPFEIGRVMAALSRLIAETEAQADRPLNL